MIKNNVFFCIMLLILGCNTNNPQSELKSIIDSYHDYKGHKNGEFPLGDFSEERFENYALFCDSLKLKLETIDRYELEENDQISYQLLHFVLKETGVKFHYNTHWNPILSDAGFHSNLTYRVRPISSKKSALKYLNLLKAIPL